MRRPRTRLSLRARAEVTGRRHRARTARTSGEIRGILRGGRSGVEMRTRTENSEERRDKGRTQYYCLWNATGHRERTTDITDLRHSVLVFSSGGGSC